MGDITLPPPFFNIYIYTSWFCFWMLAYSTLNSLSCFFPSLAEAIYRNKMADTKYLRVREVIDNKGKKYIQENKQTNTGSFVSRSLIKDIFTTTDSGFLISPNLPSPFSIRFLSKQSMQLMWGTLTVSIERGVDFKEQLWVKSVHGQHGLGSLLLPVWVELSGVGSPLYPQVTPSLPLISICNVALFCVYRC